MPPKRSFDAELTHLETLRHVSGQEAEPQLARSLGLKFNFLVAKAATLAQHHRLASLTPQLVEAFPKFFENAVKSDPQCWAKNAIAKALAHFEYQDADLFLMGMRHHQLEPVWGGSEDTAGTLRGTCAFALVQCRSIDSHRLLKHLVGLFSDKVLSVRVNAARAVEQVGSDSAALLLRLRAELASDSSELLGACYSGVLSLEGPSAIPWAARFLPPEDDAAAEAAMAIAQTRTPEAYGVLHAVFPGARDAWFRKALLAAIALTRQPEAAEFLLKLIESESRHADDAHEALCLSGPGPDVVARLHALGRPCG